LADHTGAELHPVLDVVAEWPGERPAPQAVIITELTQELPKSTPALLLISRRVARDEQGPAEREGSGEQGEEEQGDEGLTWDEEVHVEAKPGASGQMGWGSSERKS